MKKIVLSLLFFLGYLATQAQISGKGYRNFDWGTDKVAFTKITQTCSSSFLDDALENCSVTADSLFLDEFPHKFLNYRFFKHKFFEVNIDFDNQYLPYIISKLTKQYGSPSVISKETNPAVKSSSFILYSWQMEDTKINILKKEESMPAWVNISCQSLKKSIPNKGEIDIEKILFE